MGSTQQQRLEEALLREIERLTQLPPDCFERLQICGTFPEIVSKMGLLEAWRFLRRVKSQDGESGLTNWLLGWILGRRALVREANLQLALALNRTFGCERYHVLLEAGRLGSGRRFPPARGRHSQATGTDTQIEAFEECGVSPVSHEMQTRLPPGTKFDRRYVPGLLRPELVGTKGESAGDDRRRLRST